MKWLISSCILVVFSVDIMYTESEKKDCIEQLANQSLLEESCMSRSLYNSTEFNVELMLAITQYWGNNETVDAFTNKYCTILRRVLECSNIGHDVDVDCLYPLAREIEQQNYDRNEAVLNYVCANNAQVIFRVLGDRGFDTIIWNEHFDECIRPVTGVRKRVDGKTLESTTEMCDAVDRVFACYADFTREHANQDLAAVGNELRAVVRVAYKC